MKKINLSEKQRHILDLLQKGSVMFVSHPYFVSSNDKIIIRTGNEYETVNKSTFKSLKQKELIYQYKYESREQSIYKLTELGKTFKL